MIMNLPECIHNPHIPYAYQVFPVLTVNPYTLLPIPPTPLSNIENYKYPTPTTASIISRSLQIPLPLSSTAPDWTTPKPFSFIYSRRSCPGPTKSTAGRLTDIR